tara:strand:+ start:245 stop:385 length:141 start_codon:yes stop_codon:yes gene_type:complete
VWGRVRVNSRLSSFIAVSQQFHQQFHLRKKKVLKTKKIKENKKIKK